MFRRSVVIAVVASATLTAAPARAATRAVPLVDAKSANESPKNGDDECHSTAVGGIGKDALDAATGIAGDVLGAGADAAAGGVMGAVVDWASGGAAYLIGRIAEVIDRSTKPQLRSAWFGEKYAAMARL